MNTQREREKIREKKFERYEERIGTFWKIILTLPFIIPKESIYIQPKLITTA